ncbi:MAG: hypothetical protein FWB79_05965 [Treponema sp.]|nr:hypothetical protein [Treponema sp.]
MLNFEHVKLLEAKVAKAIDYVERINREKNALLQRDTEIRGKLESYQKQEAEFKAQLDSYQSRIDELEVLVSRFREDQDKIEEGILSALDRLSQFEKDIDKSLKGKANDKAPEYAEENAETESEPADDDPDLPDPLLYAPDGDDDSDDSQEKGGELEIF